MTTLIDTVKPTESYLDTLLPGALIGRTEAEYVDAYLTGLISRLVAAPKMYRSFGPWWPAVKLMILDKGETRLGQTVEGDVASIYTTSRPAYTIIAAHLYSDMRMDNNGVYNQIHLLDVASYADDTEPYIYTSYDESIEKYHV